VDEARPDDLGVVGMKSPCGATALARASTRNCAKQGATDVVRQWGDWEREATNRGSSWTISTTRRQPSLGSDGASSAGMLPVVVVSLNRLDSPRW
jgi:hypothetical protein